MVNSQYMRVLNRMALCIASGLLLQGVAQAQWLSIPAHRCNG